MINTLHIEHNEIERRKDLYRRVFDYKPVDHLPVFIWVQGPTCAEHTIRWELESSENQLAANLTTQVRAIAEVSTAVTKGDLTRFITVEAEGEVLALRVT